MTAESIREGLWKNLHDDQKVSAARHSWVLGETTHCSCHFCRCRSTLLHKTPDSAHVQGIAVGNPDTGHITGCSWETSASGALGGQALPLTVTILKSLTSEMFTTTWLDLCTDWSLGFTHSLQEGILFQVVLGLENISGVQNTKFCEVLHMFQ